MVRSSPGVTPRIALSMWKVMATVSTAWPRVAGRRVIERTVPEKIVPAARAIRGKPNAPGVIGKRRLRSLVGGAPIPGGKGIPNSGAPLTRPDWLHSQAGARIKTQIVSRHVQLLPYMGRPHLVTSARRDTGETRQPSRRPRTKAVTDVTTPCGLLRNPVFLLLVAVEAAALGFPSLPS